MHNTETNELLKLAINRDTKTLCEMLSGAKFSGASIQPMPSMQSSYGRLRNHLILLKAANMIAATIGGHCVIATTRIRSGLKGNLLYPMATLPMQLGSYFLEPEHYDGFEFNANALGLKPGDFSKITDSIWWATAIPLKHSLNGSTPFASRVHSFLQNQKVAHHGYGLSRDNIDSLTENGTCLVFGGRKVSTNDAQEETKPDGFDYFCALYFLPSQVAVLGEPTPLDISDIRTTILHVVNEMFMALNESSQDDMEGFEREGLSVVSELIPALSDHEVAPSDVVAHFLSRMKGILQAHTLGIEDKHTWMRFVAINTVLDENNTCTPRFHIFPHIDTVGTNAVGSFLLSHPHRISTVKVMVHLWAQAKKFTLSDEFNDLFNELDLRSISYDPDLECVCISEDDDLDLWRKININVTDKGQETRCTLGFIIEKSFDDFKAPFPFAAIVFESDIPDAFSKRDVERFHSLVRACSKLFIALRIANTSFNVNWGIRQAYAERSKHIAIKPLDKPEESIPFGRFLFEILRLDKKVLEFLINGDDQRIWNLNERNPKNSTTLTKELAIKYILDPLKELKGTDDKSARTDKKKFFDYSGILRERNDWIATHESHLHKIWNECPCAYGVYEFLKHVPSNIVWHCYLNAIPRAIADRTITKAVTATGNGNRMPTFKVMQQHGGLSAMAMFVFAKGSQELRQIIKLSSREKIQAELNNYREHVRYKIPLSARLPSSGIAFEGDGSTNEGESNKSRSSVIRQSKSSCGALVSDLIAGAEQDDKRPVTFVLLVATLIWAQAGAHGKDAANAKIAAESLVDFENAITFQFEYNTKRWKSDPNAGTWAQHHKDDATDAVRKITRIHADGNSTVQILEEWSKKRKGSLDNRLKKLIEKLFGKPSVDATLKKIRDLDTHGCGLDVADTEKMGAIIHGDLNCRNLVWSQDYLKFFMIDFEKVGKGFEGADQLRLIFSLLADLTDEGYLKEHAQLSLNDDLIKERKGEIEALVTDLCDATDCLNHVIYEELRRREHFNNSDNASISNNGICARAIKKMFESDVFTKGPFSFWLYAATMSAAKQFEYALRGIDGSCFAPLKKIIDSKLDEEADALNFYNYYTNQELKERVHDNFALGKISRAVFAYRTIHKLMNL